jgi:hypothetical protein
VFENLLRKENPKGKRKQEKKSALPAPETDRAANDGSFASVFRFVSSFRREASLARFLTRASPLFAAAESVETAARFCLSMDMMNASHPKAFPTKLFFCFFVFVKGCFSMTQRGFCSRTSPALCFLGERVYM